MTLTDLSATTSIRRQRHLQGCTGRNENDRESNCNIRIHTAGCDASLRKDVVQIGRAEILVSPKTSS